MAIPPTPLTLRNIKRALRQDLKIRGFPEAFTKTSTLGIPEGGSRLGYNVICPVHGKSSTFSAFKGGAIRVAVTLKSNKKF